METRAGDPGAFAQFDLTRVDSPAFVVDAARLRQNLRVLADVGERSGAKVLAALKAFSMWSVAPIVGEYLDGVCTSGLWEARLAGEFYDGEIATYCAAYKAEDLPEIARISDHVIFNSPGQIARFRDVLAATGESFDIGLRINPLHAEGEVPRYDPCAPHSRLGFPVDQLLPEHLDGVSGLHFHTLCEQDFEPLRRTWEALKPRIAPFFGQLKWLNFGGGHHVTRADYQREDLVAFLRQVRAETGCELYLEPGEAVALDAGILVGTVLDVAWNGGVCTQCMDFYRTLVWLTPNWQRLLIRFDDLAQNGTGDPQVPLRRDQLVGFIVWPDRDFDVWLDDVRFEP